MPVDLALSAQYRPDALLEIRYAFSSLRLSDSRRVSWTACYAPRLADCDQAVDGVFISRDMTPTT